jgi:hypothetical protein
MDNYQHLLSKHGILSSFNIAKKIKHSQIVSIKKKLEKKYTDPFKLEKEIDKAIKKKASKIIDDTEIPGLISNHNDLIKDIKIDNKIQKKILTLANNIVKFCKNNSFNKEHVIFLIQAVFHLLKITNEDMQKFKEKYNINQDPPDDYLDEEE